MNKMRVVMVDDEKPVLDLLNRYLSSIEEVEVVGTFHFSTEALTAIPKISPDVVFLDIQMPEINGLQLAEKLIEQEDNLMIVFVTGYNQYALEAFQVHALNYLLKPVTPENIRKCISRLLKLWKRIDPPAQNGHGCMIKCFGGFEVHGVEGLVKWQTRKVEEMLAYFILHHDQTIDSYILGEILWPEYDSERVKQNLHTTLFRLRKDLKNEGIPIKIHSDKSSYRCVIEDIQCDFIEWVEKLENGSSLNQENVAKQEKIANLYKGELLGGKNYHWSFSIQEKYSDTYVKLILELVHFYADHKQYQSAIFLLKAAVHVAPLAEPLYKELFHICQSKKDYATSKKYYEALVQVLEKELGVKPHLDTVAQFEKSMEK